MATKPDGWVFGEWEAYKEYGGRHYATVSLAASDWLGEKVHRWRIYSRMLGGRLDGSNYCIGTALVKEGNGDTLDDAMAKCDEYALRYA